MEWEIVVAIGALMVTITLAVAGGVWVLGERFNKMEARIMAAVKFDTEAADASIENLSREVRGWVDQSERRFGETVQAMQQKINDFEKWTRDTFVRRDSFIAVNKETREAIESATGRIERRLERMENTFIRTNGGKDERG
jgi:hypothetical protein